MICGEATARGLSVFRRLLKSPIPYHSFFRGILPQHPPFLMRLCQRRAPMGLDSPIAGRVGKKHVSFRNLSGAPPPCPNLFRGLRPRTPTYFSLVGKVGKSTFKGGGCSDSPSPLKKPPTHNGFSRGLRPLAKGATPAHSGSTHRRAGHREIMRGLPKGGGRPPFASSWKRGSRGRNPIERVSPSVRV